ncbi:hypothetical protein BKA62DRAFT_815329 [Auriculariales sp. MPI-PUGE-AT-0066]|nr:hypothetical protein BKA62DRAFT_815329 [Auriculariales sp. MPI-PUGE-AT-0066]
MQASAPLFEQDLAKRYPLKQPKDYSRFELAYPPDVFGEESGPYARVWAIFKELYAEMLKDEIEILVKQIDTMLVFVLSHSGLFSAVLIGMVAEFADKVGATAIFMMLRVQVASWVYLGETLGCAASCILARTIFGRRRRSLRSLNESARLWALRILFAKKVEFGMDTFVADLSHRLYRAMAIFLLGMMTSSTELTRVAVIIPIFIGICIFFGNGAFRRLLQLFRIRHAPADSSGRSPRKLVRLISQRPSVVQQQYPANRYISIAFIPQIYLMVETQSMTASDYIQNDDAVVYYKPAGSRSHRLYRLYLRQNFTDLNKYN